jgi:hypothetical protein
MVIPSKIIINFEKIKCSEIYQILEKNEDFFFLN